MARIFPEINPQNTGSNQAEPDIYWRLKKQLSDDFVVIHSLPWLASVAKEIDGRSVPTGEIDFIVLHQKLGILAVEVKGGIFTYNKTKFIYKRTGQKIDPIRQVRRGTHALAKLLHRAKAGSWRIGYCIIFPHSEIRESIPISLIDFTVETPQPIILDIRHLNNLGKEIQAIMSYWKKALNTWFIKKQEFEKLIDVLLPSSDYSPCLQTRINNDTVTWLKLTSEQSRCLDRIGQENRLVVTGFPGTGKTLLLIEQARRLSKLEKKVLVITYNYLLSKRLQNELFDVDVEVSTFHEQCRRAVKIMGKQIPDFITSPDIEDRKKEWYDSTAPSILEQALAAKKLPNYDALLIDEGQVLDTYWLQILTWWFDKKQIIVFCDSTQVFNFEESTPPEDIVKIINAKSPYILTLNLRSPRKIFERVSQVKKSEYQQFCPRSYEEDTLKEIVVDDTMYAFLKIVDELLKEGISKESIVIIDTVSRHQKQLSYKGIEIVRASRFRGLESPVVIILADDTTDENSLFCAYTRATSRCIVIYSAVRMTTGSYGNFGNLILDDDDGLIQEEANLGLTSSIFDNANFEVITVADKSINLSWCFDWGGWVIDPTKNDQVAQLIWTHHLIVATNYPVYTWNASDRGKVICFNPIKQINSESDRSWCNLYYCENCRTVTLFILNFSDKIYECTICLRSKQKVLFKEIEEELKKQAEFDDILSLGTLAKTKDKKKLTIFLMALGRWNTISEVDKQDFNNCSIIMSGKSANIAAKLLVLTDIIKLNKNIILDEIATKYRAKWCPDLVNRIDEKSWRNTVAHALNSWFGQGILEKIDKGIYKRK